MAKFIRVSEVFNDVVKTVLINVDIIEHIKVGNKGTDTFIKLITPSPKLADRTGWFFVKESLEEIERQLFTDMSRPPIIMSADEYKDYLAAKDAASFHKNNLRTLSTRTPADLKSIGT